MGHFIRNEHDMNAAELLVDCLKKEGVGMIAGYSGRPMLSSFADNRPRRNKKLYKPDTNSGTLSSGHIKAEKRWR